MKDGEKESEREGEGRDSYIAKWEISEQSFDGKFKHSKMLAGVLMPTLVDLITK